MTHEQIKMGLFGWFGEAWARLSAERQQRVLEDYVDAYREDGCSLSEYHTRIGAGNLSAYADSLIAGSKPHMRNYPHEGGCPRCRELRVCNACGESLGPDRCTNGRCPHCHAMICEPGGSVSSGHGFGNAKLRRLT